MSAINHELSYEALMVLIGQITDLLSQECVPGDGVVERVGNVCARNLALRQEIHRLKKLLYDQKESAK